MTTKSPTFRVVRHYMGKNAPPSKVMSTGMTMGAAHLACSNPPSPITGTCDNQSAVNSNGMGSVSNAFTPMGSSDAGPDIVQESGFDQCAAFDTFEQE